ncbi:MAG: hypothetical protein KJO25_00625, partial [Bacteroidia bacterium]|nr:hypothetical protein [Bacteroidia bacterium]
LHPGEADRGEVPQEEALAAAVAEAGNRQFRTNLSIPKSFFETVYYPYIYFHKSFKNSIDMKQVKILSLALLLLISFSFLSFTDDDDTPTTNRGDDDSSQNCHTEWEWVWVSTGGIGFGTFIPVTIEVCD